MEGRVEKIDTAAAREERKTGPVPGLLLAGEYNNAGKKGPCEMERNEFPEVTPRPHPPRAAGRKSAGRVSLVEGRAEAGAWRGCAPGIDVINKSVNGVSGLMSVVTRWLGGWGRRRWHQPTSYPTTPPPPPPLAANRFPLLLARYLLLLSTKLPGLIACLTQRWEKECAELRAPARRRSKIILVQRFFQIARLHLSRPENIHSRPRDVHSNRKQDTVSTLGSGRFPFESNYFTGTR